MTRVLLTGGGTGGHVYPALAVAEALREAEPAVELQFAGTPAGIERRLAEQAGIPFVPVPASGFRGLGVMARLRFGLNLVRGVAGASTLLGRWRPNVVVGTGGYVTLPVLLAARLRGVPCALQEQNAWPGSANRLAARWAQRVYLGIEAAAGRLPRDRCLVTGNPVRAAFAAAVAAGPRSATEPGLRLLVFGGSRGARTLNRALVEAAPLWRDRSDLELWGQTGKDDHDLVRDAHAEWPSGRARITPYIDDMPAALSWADLVVSRAGAMTLAEIAATGKPAILVPFPFATDDHQRHNAEAFQRAGAAELLPDDACDGSTLVRSVLALADGPEKLRAMGRAAAAQARPHAARDIAEDVLRLASGKGRT